jgi:hypothetical protein
MLDSPADYIEVRRAAALRYSLRLRLTYPILIANEQSVGVSSWQTMKVKANRAVAASPAEDDS